MKTLSPDLLFDCEKKYGKETVEEALQEFKRLEDKVRKPIAWFRQICLRIDENKRVEKFEREWKKQKQFVISDDNPINKLCDLFPKQSSHTDEVQEAKVKALRTKLTQ